MNTYNQHRMVELDPSGFGVKYLDRLNSYAPHHWHKALELGLMIRGSVTCAFENGSSHFKTGELFLINSYEAHETRCSRTARVLVVHIDPGMMCHYSPTFDQLLFSLAFNPEDTVKSDAFHEIQLQMKRIFSLTQEKTGVALLERQACLFTVAALLEKNFSKPLALEESSLHRSDMARLEPILEYVQLHHGEDLQLEDAASAMGLNKEYFCRLFKKNMGITHLQYIYQVRAAAVCRDLELTDDPIGEIAQRHGFRDSKTLNQYFKELYGCTPSEKRKFFREVAAEDTDDDTDEDAEPTA